ncbi:MAG: Smr/MutS family protein [Rikenellaceae bacterium]
MIYPQDFESRLGFERIRQMINDGCSTELAREIAAQCSFSTDLESVRRDLLRTSQMVECLTVHDDFPRGGYVDTNHFLKKIGVVGMYMDGVELLSLRRSLELLNELVQFFSEKDQFSELKKLIENIGSFTLETGAITAIIDDFAVVRDNASAELAQIRSDMVHKEREIGRKLQSILRAAQSEGIVDEDVSLSMRDGRLVIPIASQFKRKIKGFVYDESATGKTSYVEPIEVVELNNAVKELEAREKREIKRILTQFTASLAPRKQELRDASYFISLIDFIKSKASFAIKTGGVMPILSDEMCLELRGARHPLLEMALARDGKKIVPLDMALDSKKHILVISGPNAGGKSVCLKSVGLLQYMVQCGLLPPVKENSTFGMFENIFIDIGDQQSLDNDLSTYSSHLQNMKTLLKFGNNRSLVLIDEFGTGTEPTIGGAIAESILESMEARGMFAVVTTHYTNLKYYADKAEGVISGAMTFDVHNITPLFKLEMGKPGSSFALEIAHKIGLPDEIIAKAKSKIGDGQVSLERQLREVARDKRYWEGKRDRIRIAERKADELAASYEKELLQLKEQRNSLVHDAKAEAAKIVQGANKLIENTIFEIRKSQAEKEQTKLARKKVEEFLVESPIPNDEPAAEIDKKMEQLRAKEERRRERKELRGEMAAVVAQLPPPPKPRTIKIGDSVRIKGQNTIGKLVEVSGRRAVVHYGTMATTIEPSKLEYVSASDAKGVAQQEKTFGMVGKPSMSYDSAQKRVEFSQQIDLRGMRVEEAMMRSQEFVDEAYMLGIKEVKILHGKGTGALKQEIRKLLHTLPFVVSATDEHEQFGGSGITVVTIS